MTNVSLWRTSGPIQPKFPDEQRCMQIKSVARKSRFSIRKDYVAKMLKVEESDPSNNKETKVTLETELKSLEEKDCYPGRVSYSQALNPEKANRWQHLGKTSASESNDNNKNNSKNTEALNAIQNDSSSLAFFKPFSR
ncbi:hypothetical protein TNCV_2171411 [Trichonephila clavipes]|nr:hypothetical protein TNCV_2171411 [Trichonephila clavipes]